MEISTQPLTEEAFAPFGQVIAMGPLGRAHSTRYAADVENKRAAARLNVSISQQIPTPLPLTVKAMEMHPHSAQTFIPTEIKRYLVLVCPEDSDGNPKAESVCGGGKPRHQLSRRHLASSFHGFG